MPAAASLVMAANQRSVAMAVVGDTPKKSRSIGVINAPPPTPVSPTTKPVKAPAAVYAPSIMEAGQFAQGDRTGDEERIEDVRLAIREPGAVERGDLSAGRFDDGLRSGRIPLGRRPQARINVRRPFGDAAEFE